MIKSIRLIQMVTVAAVLLITAACHHSKQSLYEEIDHEHPEHWPSDMSNAATKIRQRLERIKSSESGDSKALAELKDLIGWVPEIAGDTSLNEQQWQPIYDQSEAIRKLLAQQSSAKQYESEIENLCKTLQEAHESLPENEKTLSGSDSAQQSEIERPSSQSPSIESPSTNAESGASDSNDATSVQPRQSYVIQRLQRQATT